MSVPASETLMKSVYMQRLVEMVPQMLKWYELKERKLQQILDVEKDVLIRLEGCVNITIKELAYIVMFLKEERQCNQKNIESREHNTLLKTVEKHKSQKDQAAQEGDPALVDIEQWNPTLFKFFDTLTEANLDHKVALKKMQNILDELFNMFQKEEDAYKSLMKKLFRAINKRLQDVEEASKDQRKIVVKYHEIKGKNGKDALTVLSDLKQIQFLTSKQISGMVARSMEIKELVEKIICQEKRIAKLFKQQFTRYMAAYENLYRLSNNFMSLGKTIDKIEQEQDGYKINYFNKKLLSEKTRQMIGQIVSVQAKDDYSLLFVFLQLTDKQLQQLVQLQSNIDHLSEQIIFRKWNLHLAEGWLIETWTKCKGCIALDGHFVLFGDIEAKPLKVINAKASKISKKEQYTAFLTESVPGFFSKSDHEYKLRFDSLDELQEFQLYVANQIK